LNYSQLHTKSPLKETLVQNDQVLTQINDGLKVINVKKR